MLITIINDCRDPNAMGRQAIRAASLFPGCPIIPIGVSSDLEAAGNLVDALDAAAGRPGVILVNVAPRNGSAHQFSNGTPFCTFKHQQTLVVASVKGRTLDLAHKLGLVKDIKLIDLEETVYRHTDCPATAERIIASQFRSFEFVPWAAYLLHSNKGVVATHAQVKPELSAGNAIWMVDCFGNIKTTALSEEIGFADGAELEVFSGRSAVCYADGLQSVPDGQLGIVVGSSGTGDKKFIEVVINGGRAADELGVGNLDSAKPHLVFQDKISVQAATA